MSEILMHGRHILVSSPDSGVTGALKSDTDQEE